MAKTKANMRETKAKSKELGAFCVLVSVIAYLLSTGAASAARIVSLLPSNTEIIESLGDGSEIVGVTEFEKDTLPGTRRVVIGDFVNPSIEKIVSLKPDLIVAGAWESSRTVPELRRLGYRMVEVHNPRSIADLYQTVRQLAAATGRAEQGKRVISLLAQRRKDLQSRRPNQPLKTYIEIDRPQWTVGGIDFLSEALADAGAFNIFSDLQKEAGQVSSEVVIERNPDLIITLADKKEDILRRPGWGNIAAVRHGWIIDDIDPNRLTRPSPRLWDGIEQIEQRILAWRGKVP